MTILKYQIEIEKMLVYIHNFFCVNHIDSVWSINAFLIPTRGVESLVENTFKRLYYKYIIVTHIENEAEINLIDEFKSIYNELKPHYCECIDIQKSVSQFLGKAYEAASAEILANNKFPQYHIFITD